LEKLTQRHSARPEKRQTYFASFAPLRETSTWWILDGLLGVSEIKGAGDLREVSKFLGFFDFYKQSIGKAKKICYDFSELRNLRMWRNWQTR